MDAGTNNPEEVKTSTIALSLGIVSDPLGTQLEKLGFKYKDSVITELEGCRKAMNDLKWTSPPLLNDKQYNLIKTKIYKRVVGHVCKVNKLTLVKHLQ